MGSQGDQIKLININQKEANMNTWNFTGFLGQDSTVSTTQSGTTVCDFSVAVSSGYGDNKKTTWANCVLFGKRAEGALPGYLTKGQQVAVSGEMTLETWESQSGVKGSKVKVFVNSLDLIGDKSQQQQAPQQRQAPQQQQQQYQQTQQPGQPQFQQAPPQNNRQNNNGPQQSYQQQPVDNFDDIPF